MDKFNIKYFIIFMMVNEICCYNRNPGDINKFLEHIKLVNDFPCQIPQPRTFKFSELQDDLQPGTYVVKPPMTVLYRCDEYSGCCANWFSCKPETTEDVDIVFNIKQIGNGDEFKYIKATNHTKCICMKTR